jgi:Ca-activated chloride channel homolog
MHLKVLEILCLLQEIKMEFDVSSLLIALTGLLIFALLWLWQYRRKRKTAAIVFSGVKQLRESGKSWRIQFRKTLVLLRILALIVLLIAFTRPRKGLETIQTAKEGIAIQMIIDRSSSMKEPFTYQGQEMDRLEGVKQVFEAFVLGNKNTLPGRPNDMIGLTSFAGFVEENTPLTLDHQNIVNFARTITPAIKIEDGTMIGDALYYTALRLVAVDELLKKAEKDESDYHVKSKIIILLTDGQQTRGGMSPIEAANFAKDNDIKVYTIAIADSELYQKNNSLLGQFFSLNPSQVDTQLIEEVARITGGLFAKAKSGEGLIKIYEKINQLEKSKFEEKFTTFKEQFMFFVYIGLGLLMLELVLSQTLFRKIP